MSLWIPAYLRGDLAGAERCCAAGLDLWRALGNSWGTSMALRALADVVCERGEARRAAALYGDALALQVEQAEQWGIADSLSGLAAVASTLGEPRAAARLFGAAEALYELSGICLPPPDRPHFVRAVANARTAVAASDPDWDAALADGRGLTLEQALVEGEAVVAAARQRSPSLRGESETISVTSVVTGFGLTPRERDVLRLLAADRSNEQIGEALVISPRTAQTHVTHLMAKLGLATRTEAAAFAHRHGLA